MNQLVQTENDSALIEFLDRAEDRFEFAPLGMVFDQEKSFAIQLLEANGHLKKVAFENPRSLLSAMSNVASVGLSLNPAKKQAYLIPRNVKVDGRWVSKICFDPSYMGLIDLACGIGSIIWAQAKCVYKNEKFIDNGVGEKPTHEFEPFATNNDRGEFVGVYCVAKTRDGDYLTTTMNAEKILDIMEQSESVKAFRERGKGSGGPWFTFFEEMAKKTVVRNAFKLWPKAYNSDEMNRMAEAVNISNENEGFEPIINNPELTHYTAKEKAYFDELISTDNRTGMFIFMTSISSGVQTSLYNSFEKGSIVKYKTVVSQMIQKGQSFLFDCREALREAHENNDDMAAKELLQDLNEESIEWLCNELNHNEAGFIRTCVEEIGEN